LTNGERQLATLRALAMVQLEICGDVATLTFGDEDFEEDEAA